MRVHRFHVPPSFLRIVLAGLAWAGIVSNPPARADERGTAPAEAPRAVAVLEVVWPHHPEWLAMLVDILQGSQLGPEDGWFRRAVAQSRYDWDGVRRRLDRDGDGRIVLAEFAGPDADFARLDRDGNGVLTAADFDFTPHALMPSVGSLWFSRADRDGNGKLTRGTGGVLRPGRQRQARFSVAG